MPAYIFIILRLLIILVIGLVTFLMITKLVTWPQRSKSKRIGQITEDQNEGKSSAIVLYLLVWIMLISLGFFAIKYLL